MILGASKPEQLIENLGALDVIPKITDEIKAKIDQIFPVDPDAPTAAATSTVVKSLVEPVKSALNKVNIA